MKLEMKLCQVSIFPKEDVCINEDILSTSWEADSNREVVHNAKTAYANGS